MTNDDLIILLIEADAHPLGAVVKTNAPEKLRMKLYPVMRETGVHFTLSIPLTPGELWLIKKRN